MSSMLIRNAKKSCGSAIAATFVLVTALVSGSCGSSASPSGPYGGVWSGSIEDNLLGRGNLEITLTDTANLDGTWLANVSGTTVGGSLSIVPATAGSTERQFAMSCGAPPAGGSILFVTPLDRTTLQGRYVALGCGRLTGGTARVTRR